MLDELATLRVSRSSYVNGRGRYPCHPLDHNRSCPARRHLAEDRCRSVSPTIRVGAAVRGRQVHPRRTGDAQRLGEHRSFIREHIRARLDLALIIHQPLVPGGRFRCRDRALPIRHRPSRIGDVLIIATTRTCRSRGAQHRHSRAKGDAARQLCVLSVTRSGYPIFTRLLAGRTVASPASHGNALAKVGMLKSAAIY